MRHTGLISDPLLKAHNPGPGHPEQPARIAAILDRLHESGIADELEPLPARAATDDELALVHDRRYVELVAREVKQGRPQLSTGDTNLSGGSLDAARIAAGAVLNAVDAVFSKAVQNAFCAIRPPGHHASRGRGMGFCVFNNIAVGACYAQRRYGAGRVLIADWDVHHGNGTQDIFYEDPSVYFFSTHQSPWYPGTGATEESGAGKGVGTTRNCPFPAGAGAREIIGAFRTVLLPAAQDFKPDLVMISAGFDSRKGDPLGDFLLADRDFAALTTIMMEIAGQSAAGRLVSVLEGGYNLSGLASATEAHLRALLGQ